MNRYEIVLNKRPRKNINTIRHMLTRGHWIFRIDKNKEIPDESKFKLGHYYMERVLKTGEGKLVSLGAIPYIPKGNEKKFYNTFLPKNL